MDIQKGSTKIDVYLVQLLNRVRRKAIFRQYDLFTQYISEVPELLKKALYTQSNSTSQLYHDWKVLSLGPLNPLTRSDGV
jgi:hypothetical protein